jgi:hypothetical protein
MKRCLLPGRGSFIAAGAAPSGAAPVQHTRIGHAVGTAQPQTTAGIVAGVTRRFEQAGQPVRLIRAKDRLHLLVAAEGNRTV